MSDQVIIGVLFTVVQAAFWLWLKTSMTKTDKTANDLIEFKLLVADNYVKQTQLDAHMDRIDKSLDEIKIKIEILVNRNAK
ncbi:MAG: hypothetical protein ACJAV1_002724 [Paraglaciecola sp.]|jgi:hypothetical protein